MDNTQLADADASPVWTVSADQVLREFGSGNDGLTAAEAGRRLQQYGPNRLPQAKGRSALQLFFDQFKSALILILLAAVALAGIVGDLKDAVLIGVVVLFNAVLGFVQEYRAEKTVAALQRMLPPQARVRRDGRPAQVSADQIVPGDVVLLEAGDRVPADGRLLSAASVEINESTLTGESVPVVKRASPIPKPSLALADRENCAFLNTAVTRGRAELLVTATGAQTEVGKLAGMIQGAPQERTPLQRQLDGLGRRLALIAGIFVLLVSILEAVRGIPASTILLNAVALAVAAIPEGLPAVVTVTLALGMRRLARNRAIVKRMSSVETLGCTTDICSDKTGTLTLNEMTARAALVRGRRLAISGEGYRPEGRVTEADGSPLRDRDGLRPVLTALALCNDSDVRDGALVGDPTEGALLTFAEKGGVDVRALRREMPRVGEVPFDSERKYMATVHGEQMFVKGAPDVLLERCSRVLGPDGERPLDDGQRRALRAEVDGMAAQALRVLAVALREGVQAGGSEGLEGQVRELTLLGLVGMIDPPRAEAREAIAMCKSAGIRVRMITGDHAATARAIAQELGLRGEVVAGSELDGMDDATLGRRLPETAVFARVAPEHKVRLVRSLRAAGRTVAMTGDGVNDAPALKNADIGVAMGITGTDVTKEAGSMVLTDDNFATIVNAVREGRTIYDNIVKFLRFQLSTNIGALTTALFAPLVGLPLPFTALQILWVNMIMDGPPAMALGVDPPRPGIMSDPPRDPTARILDGRRLLTVGFLGAIMAVGTIGVFWYGMESYGQPRAGALAFTTFVLFQFFNVPNARIEHGSAFTSYLFRNGKLWAALAVVLLLQVLAVYAEPLQRLLGTEALSPRDWGLAVIVASSVLVLEQLRRFVFTLFRRTPRAEPGLRRVPA